MGSEQRTDFLEQFRVAPALPPQELVLLLWRQTQGRLQQFIYASPAFSVHRTAHVSFRGVTRLWPCSSRARLSSARPFNISAASSKLSPPKKRSSTTCALRASISANARSASSKARISTSMPRLLPGSNSPLSSKDKVLPPPRFPARCRRA